MKMRAAMHLLRRDEDENAKVDSRWGTYLDTINVILTRTWIALNSNTVEINVTSKLVSFRQFCESSMHSSTHEATDLFGNQVTNQLGTQWWRDFTHETTHPQSKRPSLLYVVMHIAFYWWWWIDWNMPIWAPNSQILNKKFDHIQDRFVRSMLLKMNGFHPSNPKPLSYFSLVEYLKLKTWISERNYRTLCLFIYNIINNHVYHLATEWERNNSTCGMTNHGFFTKTMR